MEILKYIIPETEEITARYITAQSLGIVFTVLCVISLFMKNRKKLLIFAGISNFLNMIAMLLLGAYSSAFIAAVAVFQIYYNVWQIHSGIKPKKWEIPLFTVLFLIGGIAGYKCLYDLIPISASMVFMASVQQKKKIAYLVLSLTNCVMLTVYNIIIGSTALFGIAVTEISLIIVIIRTLVGKNSEF